jgi:hypothetical protein
MSEEVQSWINGMRKRLEANTGSSFRKELAVMALAAYCYETRVVWGEDEALYRMPFPIDFLAEFHSYGFWITVQRNPDVDFLGSQKRIEAFSAEQKKRVDSMLFAYSEKAKEMHQLFTVIEERAGALITDTESKSAALDASISDAVVIAAAQQTALEAEKARLDKLLSDISTAEENVQAFAKAVREEFKFDTTKKLWNRRAARSTWSFWLSALVIVFAIVGPPYWVITHVDTVVSFLRSVGDAAIHGLPADQTNTHITIATISRLVIVSAPLALYFWAIKLIVRYNTRSMVLMDDARQRQTTMDTFFNLIENNKASPKERGLMLNALFKPLPGQGDENIEPPNFIDLISQRKP